MQRARDLANFYGGKFDFLPMAEALERPQSAADAAGGLFLRHRTTGRRGRKTGAKIEGRADAMKTLEQIAEAAGVTKAAIYKRFQSYGLTFNQVKAEKQGRTKVYSEDVERLIILMFQPEAKVESLVENKVTEHEAKIQELQGTAANLQVENKAANQLKEAAEKAAAAAEARAERAEAQNEALLQQIDKLTDAIRAAEAVQAAQMAKLAAPPPEEKKGGLFERLRRRLKGGKEA